MNFVVKKKRQTLYVLINGEIKNDHVPKLEEELNSLLRRDFQQVVFDFALVPFIQTAPIGIFLNFCNRLLHYSKDVGIVELNPLVWNLFELVGLDNRIWIQLKPEEKYHRS